MQKTHITYPAFGADPYKLIVGLGMLLMAVEPVRWLVTSWIDPAYDSKGLWVFALCAALFAWSVRSPREYRNPADEKKAYGLLTFTALVRGIGQLLAMNVIGAGALVIDVYAMALLFGLKYRWKPVSPGWLALLFAFSLPLERILQRVGGFGLQQVSALGACAILKALFANTACNGVRILVDNQDVLVDLPCSGARMLVIICILYLTLMALLRPKLIDALGLGAFAVAGACVANALRITLVATLAAHPVFGIDAMAQPWHDIIGLVFLAATALPVTLLAVRSSPTPVAIPSPLPQGRSRMTPAAAFSFLVAAIVVVSLPHKPLDVGAPPDAVALPAAINGAYGTPVLLSAREKDYFLRYGGMAMKVAYGENSVMLVQTTSPLRHLHSPDECLRGMGFSVQYQGLHYDPLPTATYMATAPDGRKWRVAVSFYASRDEFASNVAEAVWRWMQHPGTTWHALQRITPASISDEDARRWDSAVFAALDLTPHRPQEIAYAKIH